MASSPPRKGQFAHSIRSSRGTDDEEDLRGQERLQQYGAQRRVHLDIGTGSDEGPGGNAAEMQFEFDNLTPYPHQADVRIGGLESGASRIVTGPYGDTSVSSVYGSHSMGRSDHFQQHSGTLSEPPSIQRRFGPSHPYASPSQSRESTDQTGYPPHHPLHRSDYSPIPVAAERAPEDSTQPLSYRGYIPPPTPIGEIRSGIRGSSDISPTSPPPPAKRRKQEHGGDMESATFALSRGRSSSSPSDVEQILDASPRPPPHLFQRSESALVLHPTSTISHFSSRQTRPSSAQTVLQPRHRQYDASVSQQPGSSASFESQHSSHTPSSTSGSGGSSAAPASSAPPHPSSSSSYQHSYGGGLQQSLSFPPAYQNRPPHQQQDPILPVSVDPQSSPKALPRHHAASLAVPSLGVSRSYPPPPPRGDGSQPPQDSSAGSGTGTSSTRPQTSSSAGPQGSEGAGSFRPMVSSPSPFPPSQPTGAAGGMDRALSAGGGQFPPQVLSTTGTTPYSQQPHPSGQPPPPPMQHPYQYAQHPPFPFPHHQQAPPFPPHQPYPPQYYPPGGFHGPPYYPPFHHPPGIMPMSSVSFHHAEYIQNINNNDVLCGRGGATNSHIGNRSFRQLVKKHQERYLRAKKKEKPAVAAEIVEMVRNFEPPGRFLKKDKATGYWLDIGDERAKEKTSQALREGAPELRRQRDREEMAGSSGSSASEPDGALSSMESGRGTADEAVKASGEARQGEPGSGGCSASLSTVTMSSHGDGSPIRLRGRQGVRESKEAPAEASAAGASTPIPDEAREIGEIESTLVSSEQKDETIPPPPASIESGFGSEEATQSKVPQLSLEGHEVPSDARKPTSSASEVLEDDTKIGVDDDDDDDESTSSRGRDEGRGGTESKEKGQRKDGADDDDDNESKVSADSTLESVATKGPSQVKMEGLSAEERTTYLRDFEPPNPNRPGSGRPRKRTFRSSQV